MDFGVANGLAARIPYDQMIGDLRYNQQAQEAAKERAENRARMFADDTSYNNAMNSFDNAKVKGYATQKIQELGKWQRENPNWRFDPMKMAEYKQQINDLKDNPDLQRGLRVDSHIKKMQDWFQDSKNADVKDLPEAQQYKQNLANYLSTGSIDGNPENKQEFRFEPPTTYDFNPLLEQYGKKTPKTLKSKAVLANGLLSLQYGSTDNDIKNQAESYLKNLDPYQSKRWTYNYKNKLEQLGQSPDKYSLEDYTKDALEGHVTPDDYQHAGYHVSEGGGSGGKQRAPETGNSLLSEILQKSYKNPGQPQQFTPASAEALYTGRNGILNTGGAKIFSKDMNGGLKNVIDLKGISTDDWDFSNTKITSMPIYDPQHKGIVGHSSYVSGTVRLTPEQFKQMVGNEKAVYDPWGLGETELEKKYRDDAKIVTQVGKDGKKVDLIETTINLPLQADNGQTHYTSDHAAGTKALEYGYGGHENSGKYKISPDHTMYLDTETGVVYDTKTNKPINQ